MHNIWGNDLVGQVKRNGGLTRYYHLKDHLGSVRVTVDGAGSVVAYDDYDPWGMILENRSYNAGLADARFKFIGKERDAQTGNFWLDSRAYDGRIGKMFGPDALRDRPELLPHSPYHYSFNNPVRYHDGTGKSPWDILDIAAAAISIAEFAQNPTWANAGWATLDVVGAALPLVPSTGIFRHGAKLLGKFDDVADARKAMERGLESEKRVRKEMKLEKNTSKVSTKEGNAIPDAVTPDKIIEVKDAKKVNLTKQLRIETEAAKKSDKQSVLVTGKETKVSKPAKEAYDVIIRRKDLGPQKNQ